MDDGTKQSRANQIRTLHEAKSSEFSGNEAVTDLICFRSAGNFRKGVSSISTTLGGRRGCGNSAQAAYNCPHSTREAQYAGPSQDCNFSTIYAPDLKLTLMSSTRPKSRLTSVYSTGPHLRISMTVASCPRFARGHARTAASPLPKLLDYRLVF